ncbi:lasso peptide biosynthesis B2 protein [Actinomadura roseirufa]|uniref:lasso peptide biosynthesis B2 protein n=1 Tax=Actinomadura roseirufa TaxID=2094049 RepID=UPI0010411F70|nr:lasso peptide biosynthesis B2 protein [Actinomadura roseirufa]
MSMPLALEPKSPITRRRTAAARCAVAAAAALARVSPYRLHRVLTLLGRRARPATGPEALAARTAVVSVSVRCAGSGCLQRSIATVLLCRLSGSWPSWCTGVLTSPFRAHAWVEVDGVAIGEGDMPPFRKIMEIPAGGREGAAP